MTADEKDALLKEFHPDYNARCVCGNQGRTEQRPEGTSELAAMLHSNSRLIKDKVDLTK